MTIKAYTSEKKTLRDSYNIEMALLTKAGSPSIAYK